MKAKPVLVIHGGAGSREISPERYNRLMESLCRILDDVYPKLLRGQSALQAVIRAAELLEDDPLYNAGKGSKIQSDGKIRMSASLMDGHQQKFSGCVNVEGVKNPIRLAEALLKKEDRVLSEKGASQFAREIGLPFSSPFTPAAREQFRARIEGKSGTIGAIALDSKGRLAAATSTGGRGFEYPHRVSDSPTVAGNYANSLCAVSATGTGERIVEFAAAARICSWVETGVRVEDAVDKMIREAKKKKAAFGLIALDHKGNYSALTATENLIWAAASKNGLEFFSSK